MSSNSRVLLDLVRCLGCLFLGWTYWLGSGHAPPPATREVGPPRCAYCGGTMTLEAITLPDAGLLMLATNTIRTSHTLTLHARKYLDRG